MILESGTSDCDEFPHEAGRLPAQTATTNDTVVWTNHPTLKIVFSGD